MHRFFVCVTVFCALALGFSSVGFGQASIDVSMMPTEGLAGHTTFSLTAVSDDDVQIQGFDFFGNGSIDPGDPLARGFFGPMVQQSPGSGLTTVWNDFNGLINPAQDSQFAFNSGAVIIVPGTASESDSHLQAAFAASSPLGTSVPLAQIVIPDNGNAEVLYRGTVGFQTGTRPAFEVMGTLGGEPGGDPMLTATPPDGSLIDFGTLFPNTPSTMLAAINLASTGAAGTSVNIGAPIVSGPDAALFNVTGPDGDLDAGSSFDYDASFAGAPAPAATYNAMVTFSTSLGDVSYDLTAFVTPEPTSLVLLGLAMIGLVGFRRR